ncbi:MAG: hypothetical protein ACLQGT_16405 [Terracidiphilus sp.]
MSIQSDRWIRENAVQRRIVEPFSEKQLATGVRFRRLSSSGDDLSAYAEPGGAK